MNAKKKVLVSPLDWGLGHASRCVPIIRYLITQGCEVHIATSGNALLLLKKNFPDLLIHNIHPYAIHYPNDGKAFWKKILAQVPKILSAIKKENTEIKQLQSAYHYDIIISDNRYGVYHKDTTNVFITHQLQVLSGINAIANTILLRLHKYFLRKYELLWVVDSEEKDKALVPRLTHPDGFSINKKYIGYLSQIEKNIAFASSENVKKILVLLSGPEPMRSLLEMKIIEQITAMTQYEFTIISGSDNEIDSDSKHIHRLRLSDGNTVSNAMKACDMVICRSGYSSIMDLMSVRKRALLIPTPGQTEQEYIAQRLLSLGLFHYQSQSRLSLKDDIAIATQYPGFSNDNNYAVNSEFKNAIDELLFRNSQSTL